MTSLPDSARTTAWLLPAETPPPELFGLSGEERLRRVLAKAGVACIAVGDPPEPKPSGPTLLLRSDWLFDERLVGALLESEDTLLQSRDGQAVAAKVSGALVDEARTVVAGRHPAEGLPASLPRVGPDDLVPAYTHALRKREPALLVAAGAVTPAELEQRLFDASYKGITDFITKYVWPKPALPVVRACARLGVSANAITGVNWLLVGLALGLFAVGQFAAGLAAAWLMTFLDTVDGKLARVTLSSSRIGHVLDHGLDIVHPPFWYAAWGLALPAAPWLDAAMAAAVGGYVVHRGVEGLFMLCFGIEIHSWRALDARFRLITTRRNPNLVLLSAGTAAGRPDVGFALVALWTVASIAFHLVRVVQAGFVSWRGVPIRGGYEPGEATERGAR
ncbi:MAG: CDP-alcohol phosphatidyltransferase family protein [Deltaproteobacteria bacterium]|nr:CDP-alcohol phosphatidyltransferase family protein [Deltaproteobacteria bacterium]